MSVTAAQPKVDVEEAARRDFSLKPNEAADTIIALAICRSDSFRGRAAGAKAATQKLTKRFFLLALHSRSTDFSCPFVTAKPFRVCRDGTTEG